MMGMGRSAGREPPTYKVGAISTMSVPCNPAFSVSLSMEEEENLSLT